MTKPRQSPTPQQLEHDRRLAEAVAEYHDLRAREERVDVGKFCGRYPEISSELIQDIETLENLDGLLAPLPQEEPKSPEVLPERLSGHKILGMLGAGGMGQVLMAYDEGLDRKVAIKVLSPKYRDDTRLRTRFMQEARALASLSHPHIVQIFNLGPAEEPPHFVMEFLTGSPLTDAARPLVLAQKIEMLRKVVLAVGFLHRNRIIHRDLKPANILVGTDLEPKLLDFGLARPFADHGNRLTLAGEVMGTPDYFSPEQAAGDDSLDVRSDIFSLGTILYEMMTGSVPFRAENLQLQIANIQSSDPVLPRRINPEIPGALQNICMKCLEKRPGDRYASADELADDLARFLAGEPVSAAPGSYARMIAGKIDQHLSDLRGWMRDSILSADEYEGFHRRYGRLIEPEDAWILETRRMSLSQVVLYLGAWVLVAGAALLFTFHYSALTGNAAVLLAGVATAPTLWIGIRCWRKMEKRIGVAYLLAFCFLLPTTLLVAMKEWRIMADFTQGKLDLELFDLLGLFEKAPDGLLKGTTNAQIWWALALSIPAYLWLRRFTRSSVFSLVAALMGAILCIVTLLRMGMIGWFENDHGKIYFHLLPLAGLFFLTAAVIERTGRRDDSRYFYPFALLFIFAAMSGLAGDHPPYANWLKRSFPWTRGQLEYLFIINAGVYLALQSLGERFGSAQMRSAAKVFRFVIPGHVLTSILLLGVFAAQRWEEALSSADLRVEARFFEFLLPAAACLFVIASVPKQMKNFLASGLVFLAIGIVRLQTGFFRDRASWPIALLAAGILLMTVAANYTPVKLSILRLFRRTSTKSH
jgi:tRNA A-37 threonylcarbamoyl transferase component Bud32